MGLSTRDAVQGKTFPIKDAFGFCFTLNNPTYQEWFKINSLLTTMEDFGILYYGYGIEHFEQFINPQLGGGQLHLQGVVVSSKKLQLAKLKKISRRAHWETMNTSLATCVLYCSKEGKYVSMGDYKNAAIRLAHRRNYPEYKLFPVKQYDLDDTFAFIEMIMFNSNTGDVGTDFIPNYKDSLSTCVHHKHFFLDKHS